MAVAVPSTTELVGRELRRRRFDLTGAFFSVLLLTALLLSLLVLATLLVDIAVTGWPVLAERGMGFVTSGLSAEAAQAGPWQGIVGSLAVVVLVMVFVFPIGIGAAIYLEEYAPDTRLTRVINANIRNLAGVPSIVYGLLGLAVFVKLLAGLTGGRTIIAGGLTLAVLVLPIMIITAAEALRAVPDSLRQAALAVGATRWEMIRHHVLPVAAPAVLTGTVLTIARAFGETAPLLLAGAVVGNFLSGGGLGLWEQLTAGKYTVLPVIIFNWARQPQQDFVALTSAGIIVLLVVLLTVNAAAIILRDRFERKAVHDT